MSASCGSYSAGVCNEEAKDHEAVSSAMTIHGSLASVAIMSITAAWPGLRREGSNCRRKANLAMWLFSKIF